MRCSSTKLWGTSLCCPLSSFSWWAGTVVRPAVCPQQWNWVCGYLSHSLKWESLWRTAGPYLGSLHTARLLLLLWMGSGQRGRGGRGSTGECGDGALVVPAELLGLRRRPASAQGKSPRQGRRGGSTGEVPAGHAVSQLGGARCCAGSHSRLCLQAGAGEGSGPTSSSVLGEVSQRSLPLQHVL